MQHQKTLFDDQSTRGMHRQKTLFDDQSIRGMHRRSDPDTSREAAREMLRSGKAESQRAAVLEVLRRYSVGMTSAEIGRHLGEQGRFVAARRLPELERLGLVRRGEKRECHAHGTQAVTWWVL